MGQVDKMAHEASIPHSLETGTLPVHEVQPVSDVWKTLTLPGVEVLMRVTFRRLKFARTSVKNQT